MFTQTLVIWKWLALKHGYIFARKKRLNWIYGFGKKFLLNIKIQTNIESIIFVLDKCNAMVTWSDSVSSSHVIPINLDSSFAYNQTVANTLLLPPSSLSYRLGYNLLYISTSSFWSRSPTRFTEPRPSSLLDGRLTRKDYLQISAFPVWWWWSKRRSTMESH